MLVRKMLHFKCRNNVYPHSQIKRCNVSDEQVPWDFDFKDYNPPEYNSPSLVDKPWADPDISMYTSISTKLE